MVKHRRAVRLRWNRRHVIGVGYAVTAALLPAGASAQELGDLHRNGVMIWTAVVCGLALVACAIGYGYRRMNGMDHPTPDEIEMMGGHGHGDGDHDGQPEAVHPHADAEHTPVATAESGVPAAQH